MKMDLTNENCILYFIMIDEVENISSSTTTILSNLFIKNRRNTINSLLLLLENREQHVRFPNFYEEWIPKYLEYDFYLHFRMCKNSFMKISNEINHLWHNSPYRGGFIQVPREKCVLVTLWYLSKGDSLISTGDRFNLAISTVHYIVHDICYILCQLIKKYIIWPTENECQYISAEFEKRAGYPGVIGAIDGCHITCKIPVEQHDSYQDRKFNHSITIQGICSASRIFTNVSVGFPGSIHDARILEESSIGRGIATNGYKTYFYSDTYHLVGDSAYPCKIWLMTPYRDTGRLTAVQKKHNYCLSSTRVVIENVFGLLKGRWRILNYVNTYSTEKAINIITACCVLHNFCLREGDDFILKDNPAVYITPENDVRGDVNGNQKRNYISLLLT